MRRLAALVGLLPVAVAAQDGQSGEALLTALAMNDCAVTERETPVVFGSQGFEPELVRREPGQMVVDGTAFLEGGRVLRVRSEHCPPAEPVPTPPQVFRQAITERGCSIEDREAREIGMGVERIRPVVIGWIDSGAAAIEGGELTLRDCE